MATPTASATPPSRTSATARASTRADVGELETTDPTHRRFCDCKACDPDSYRERLEENGGRHFGAGWT